MSEKVQHDIDIDIDNGPSSVIAMSQRIFSRGRA